MAVDASGFETELSEETVARTRFLDLPIGAAFIGSCTNSRIEDLRDTATNGSIDLEGDIAKLEAK